jgi:hypothetical protein
MNHKENYKKYLKESKTYSGIDNSNIFNLYHYKGYDDAIEESVNSLKQGKKNMEISKQK